MNLRRILFFNALGLLLLVSWLWSSLGLWKALDEGTFWFFNQFVDARHPHWNRFLALVNMRVFDTVAALIMSTLFFWSIFLAPRGERWFRWAAIGVIMLLTAGVLALVAREGITYRHGSPTFLLDGARRLSDLVTDIRFKDVSASSFPGDHGMVLMTFSAFMFRFAKRYVAWTSALLVVLLSAPRIMVGAHWLSDIYVGSLCLVLFLTPWVLLTPISSKSVPALTRLFERLSAPVLAMLGKN